MAAEEHSYKPLPNIRLSINMHGQVEVTVSGNGGSFTLSSDEDGPYVLMESNRGSRVGSFQLKAGGQFHGWWHEKDPDHPRKEYITSFPILQHIPVSDRLMELQPKSKKQGRKKATA